MFANFLNHGSLVAVLLMGFSSSVMLDAGLQEKKDPHGLHTPRIIRSSIGSLLVFGSVPCIFWPAIYVGLFDGVIAGIASWVLLQVFCAIFFGQLNSRLLGVNFMLASIAYPIGYYLSYINLP